MFPSSRRPFQPCQESQRWAQFEPIPSNTGAGRNLAQTARSRGTWRGEQDTAAAAAYVLASCFSV